MNKRLREFSEQLVAAMPGWSLVVDDMCVNLDRLHNPDYRGAEICLYEKHGRVSVFGSFPHETYLSHELQPRISISMNRSARAAAQDIERRFLPKYLPLFCRIQQELYEAGLAIARALSVAEELAAVSGADCKPDREGGSVQTSYGVFHVTYGFNGEPSISLEHVHLLSIEQALAIAYALAPFTSD